MARSSTPRFAAFCTLAGLLALGGCGGSDFGRTFGFTRDAPDEFTVTTRAPLSIPPTLELRPPRPGASRPQELAASSAAAAALVPGAALAGNAPSTPGQQALVAAAGGPGPADIRSKVDADAALDAPGDGFVDRMMFWRTPPAPGIAVDARREAQRLRENAALGQSARQGDTPIIQQKASSWLDSLF